MSNFHDQITGLPESSALEIVSRHDAAEIAGRADARIAEMEAQATRAERLRAIKKAFRIATE